MPIASILILLSAAQLAGAQPSSAPPIDTTGVTAFWQVADRIHRGESMTAADWDAFFRHPGYAQIERSGQRRRVLEACMPAIFAQDEAGRAQRIAAIPRAFTRNVCAWLDRVRTRRQALAAYQRDADLGALYDRGLRLAWSFLPPAARNSARPAVYAMLFEENGFGGDVIAVDLNLLAEHGADSNARYFGHEFHHFYREALATQARRPSIADPLTDALDALPREGVASLIDKEPYLAPGFSPDSLAPAERETVREFLALYADVQTTLRAIDRILAAIPPDAPAQAYADAARTIDLPWGGHPAGLYLARAIDRRMGRAALTAAMLDPWRFLATYQQVARRSRGALFSFSEQSEQLIQRLASTRAS